MKLPLKGIVPPVITPLINNDTLDVKGLEKLVEHLISGGVHGLFMLGTTGEATSLSYELRKELIKRTSELVAHRIPVVVGITDTSLEGSLEIAEYSASVGLDGVVIAPPYYLPISQDEMKEYLEVIVPKLPLPFLMYDMPGCTKIHMSVGTIRRAKELGAIGVKDSSGDINYLYSLIQEFKDSPDFSIIAGTELFLPETILYGGHGAVAGGANLFPKLFVDLYNASVEQDIEKIRVLREQMIMINDLIYNVGKHTSKYIKGIKCALSVMDICDDYVAWPIRRYGKEERGKIKQYMDTLNEIIN
ncbi:MAG: dihydrodipicolinate synthase family protein [Prolixibacteraceae bacterium]|nr:dihydrodipicolinate synthase family protein [Prolixibacteraceae bacterium]